MKNLKYLLLILLLAGCGTTSTINTAPNKTPVLQVSTPLPLDLKSFKWKVITQDNMNYLALSPLDYAILSTDMEQMQSRLNLDYQTIQGYVQYQKDVNK